MSQNINHQQLTIKDMENAKIENKHVSSSSAKRLEQAYNTALPAQVRRYRSPAAPPLLLKDIIPAAVRHRQFRAHSFAAKLTSEQLAQLFGWFEDFSFSEIRKKVAEPPPVGFGLDVNITTLVRLKRVQDNLPIINAIETAMDTASDVLTHDERVADVVSLRETLSLLLYSKAIRYASDRFLPGDMDRYLSAITKLEKLRSSRESRSPSADRVRVDLMVNKLTPMSGSAGNTEQAGSPVQVSGASVRTLPPSND
jgi:hypothetical protein